MAPLDLYQSPLASPILASEATFMLLPATPPTLPLFLALCSSQVAATRVPVDLSPCGLPTLRLFLILACCYSALVLLPRTHPVQSVSEVARHAAALARLVRLCCHPGLRKLCLGQYLHHLATHTAPGPPEASSLAVVRRRLVTPEMWFLHQLLPCLSVIVALSLSARGPRRQERLVQWN